MLGFFNYFLITIQNYKQMCLNIFGFASYAFSGIRWFLHLFRDIGPKRPVDTTRPWTGEEIVGVFLI